MAPAQSKFPLFKLPSLAYENVIRVMDGLERTSCTVTSKRLKKIIKYLNRHGRSLTIQIGSKFTVITSTGEEYTLNFNRNSCIFPKSYCVVKGEMKDSENRTYYWNKTLLRLEHWMAHFLEVFNCKTISLKIIEGCQLQDFNCVPPMLQGLDRDELSISDDYIPYIREAFEAFLPVKRLIIEGYHDLRSTDCMNLIQHTSDHLSIFISADLDVECFLSMKVKSAYIQVSWDAEPVLIEFLRRWMTGIQTPLKHLIIRLDGVDEDFINSLLNGVRHQEVKRERTFEVPDKGAILVPRGYDLVRENDEKITIYPEHHDETTDVHFIFWH